MSRGISVARAVLGVGELPASVWANLRRANAASVNQRMATVARAGPEGRRVGTMAGSSASSLVDSLVPPWPFVGLLLDNKNIISIRSWKLVSVSVNLHFPRWISVGKTGLLLLFKFLFELLSSYAVNVMLRYSFTIFD